MSGGIGVEGGLEAQPHWAQVQGPRTPTGRGVRGTARGCGGISRGVGHWGW